MKKEVLIIVFISFVLAINLVNAGFKLGEPSNELKTQYSSSDFIKGWINISFQDEDASGIVEDNFENKMSLLDLLKLNPNYNYNCTPGDCLSGYGEANPQSTKTFTLNKNKEKILGFEFIGSNFEGISSFSFNISSNTQESANQQLFIDLLSDDEIEWQSYKAADNFYSENLGCYTENEEQVFIHSQDYCEDIDIPLSPNVEIGAYVTKISGDNAVFVMSVNGEGVSDSCEIVASSTGRIVCTIETKISKNQKYSVCIKTKTSMDDNKFKINSETQNTCGYAGTQSNQRDFEIFAKPGRFAGVGKFVFNSDEAENSGSNSNLEGQIEEYTGRYNNNCENGCVIPIRIISEEDNQEITLSGLSVFYTVGGTPKEAKQIYELTKIPAKVSSGFQKLNLDKANFSISGKTEEGKTYSLKLNGQNAFSEEISFNKVPVIKFLNTKTFVAAYPSKIIVNVDNSGFNITKYEWKFGNNETLSTSENQVMYTYPSVGLYKLEVKVITESGATSSKKFDVEAKTPKDAIDFVLKEKTGNFNRISQQIRGFETTHQNSIKSIIKFEDIEDSLASIQKKNSTAQTDAEYIKIMEELIQLTVPKSIFESKKASSLRFIPNKEQMNLGILKDIAGGDYDENKKNLYHNSIVGWDIENIDAQISFTEVSADYDDIQESIISVYKLKINAKQGRIDSYIIIKDLENLDFVDNYGQRQTQGYTYIKFGEEEREIEFSTTEEITFENLPIFISPEINRLSIVDAGNISMASDKPINAGLLSLIIFFVIFFGFVAYLVLQEWYKKKYESYLFKNQNDLYNIISYIEISKKRGMENKQIANGLKKSGWNSEQITYVMKKYAGERTGMFEIPLNKLINIFKSDNKKKTYDKNNKNL